MRRLVTGVATSLLLAVFAAPLGCTGGDVYIGSGSSTGSGSSAICCDGFKVGADLTDVDFGVKEGKSEFGVFAQAGADIAATATVLLDDVTNACRAIAQDLGADGDKQAAAATEDNGRKRVELWCQLAVTQLRKLGISSSSFKIEPSTYTCETSVPAKLACQARCAGTPTCDAHASPLRCTGGTLMSECEGTCAGTIPGGAFACKGSCDVVVSGTCSADGVACEGRCEGLCEGTTDDEGKCQGTCKGTCAATVAKAKCSGSFNGLCEGKCTATGLSTSVQCSGACAVPSTPLRCRTGKLEGGCVVAPRCDANCDASLEAKASCQVGSTRIVTQGIPDERFSAAIATLAENLPRLILAVKGRGEGMSHVFTSFNYFPSITDVVSEPGTLGVKGAACAITIVGAVGAAAENFRAAIQAGLTITGEIGM